MLRIFIIYVHIWRYFMFTTRYISPLLKCAFLGSMIIAGQHAIAAPQPNTYDGGNRWLVTAHEDSSPTHTQLATQGICFLPYSTVGTHIRGRWYSDTFPDWNGIYTQEGDQVFLHGDYASDVGHDGLQFEIVTASAQNQGFGHWAEWREDGGYGTTVSFANAKWQRVGKCNPQGTTPPQPRALTTGGIATDPLQANQVETDQTKP